MTTSFLLANIALLGIHISRPSPS